jgi:hypothetical protein
LLRERKNRLSAAALYYIIREPDLDAFAPVVVRLAGK